MGLGGMYKAGPAMASAMGAGGSLGEFMGSPGNIQVSSNYQPGGVATQNMQGMRPQEMQWLDLAQQFLGSQKPQAPPQDAGVTQSMTQNRARRQAQAMALQQFNNVESQAAQQRGNYGQQIAAQLRGY